jgi:ABC-2 type transport system ATP-binding protein
MAAIETRKLTKQYGGSVIALDSVDLLVERGESFGLLGPNGAGKTTLISILSTLLRPTSGKALVAGLDVATHQSAVRSKIGIVFQDPSLDERLTARENLILHCSLYGIPTRRRAARVDWALDLIELSQRRNDLVRTFSGGMRRRLEIARCLLHTPEVLFLDEPTIGLDPQTRDHIWSYLERLGKEQNITIILTTHYMEEADRLCGRVAIIDSGRIVAVDTPDHLKKSLGENLVTLITDRPGELLEILDLSPQEQEQAVVLSDRLALNVISPERVLSNAFRLGEARGIKVSSVSISRPTLNDVFLKYTGRELRDEQASKGNNMLLKQYARRTR